MLFSPGKKDPRNCFPFLSANRKPAPTPHLSSGRTAHRHIISHDPHTYQSRRLILINACHSLCFTRVRTRHSLFFISIRPRQTLNVTQYFLCKSLSFIRSLICLALSLIRILARQTLNITRYFLCHLLCFIRVLVCLALPVFRIYSRLPLSSIRIHVCQSLGFSDSKPEYIFLIQSSNFIFVAFHLSLFYSIDRNNLMQLMILSAFSPRITAPSNFY